MRGGRGVGGVGWEWHNAGAGGWHVGSRGDKVRAREILMDDVEEG